MKLPKTVYVAWREEDDDDRFLIAYEEPADCVDEDGPTVVGTYQYVEKKKLKRTITEA